MPVMYSTPIEKRSLSELLVQRDEWQKMADDSHDTYVEQHRQEVIADFEAAIARKSQMSTLARLLDTGYVEARDGSRRCRVSYRTGLDHLRKDHANVALYGDDGHADSTLSMHVSQVEQYVADHGIDPDGVWIDSLTKEIVTG